MRFLPLKLTGFEENILFHQQILSVSLDSPPAPGALFVHFKRIYFDSCNSDWSSLFVFLETHQTWLYPCLYTTKSDLKSPQPSTSTQNGWTVYKRTFSGVYLFSYSPNKSLSNAFLTINLNCNTKTDCHMKKFDITKNHSFG